MRKEISGCVAEMFIKSLHFCHIDYDNYSYPQIYTSFYSVYVLEIIVQRSSSGNLSVTNAAIKKRPPAFPLRVFQLGLRRANTAWQGRAAVVRPRISLWRRCFDLCAHGETPELLLFDLSFSGDAGATELGEQSSDLSQPCLVIRRGLCI
jgi:hypothetical protein